MGSGKSEIARACYGLENITAGTVHLNGEDVTGSSSGKMLDKGMFYLPPDRRKEGLVMMRSCRENIALPALRGDEFVRFAYCATVPKKSASVIWLKNFNWHR